jgi:hypothetical protein
MRERASEKKRRREEEKKRRREEEKKRRREERTCGILIVRTRTFVNFCPSPSVVSMTLSTIPFSLWRIGFEASLRVWGAQHMTCSERSVQQYNNMQSVECTTHAVSAVHRVCG